jgi:hypothetical protein
MGIMAFEAAIPGGFVNNRWFLDDLFNILVTIEAQFLPCRKQEAPVLTGMRVVAVRAAALGHYLVNAGCLVRQQIVVALEADAVGLREEKGPVVGSVRIVTLGALPLGDGGVNVAQLDLLLKSFMAGQAKLSVCTGFEFEIALSPGGDWQEYDRGQQKYNGGIP